MKYIVLMCLLVLLAGCTSQRESFSSKPNRFTEQFQQADSAFNKQYRKSVCMQKQIKMVISSSSK